MMMVRHKFDGGEYGVYRYFQQYFNYI